MFKAAVAASLPMGVAAVCLDLFPFGPKFVKVLMSNVSKSVKVSMHKKRCEFRARLFSMAHEKD